LSELEAKKLLDRASELDVERAQSLDAAALREIAIEAGISPAAIDAAVEEHLQGRQDAIQPRKRFARFTVVGRIAMILAAGYVVIALLSRIFP
jgi:8-oxo-dGTP pyrophosphatase MutT (NUDIX family)